MSEITVCKF